MYQYIKAIRCSNPSATDYQQTFVLNILISGLKMAIQKSRSNDTKFSIYLLSRTKAEEELHR